MAKSKGKGGRGDPQSHPPRGQSMTASERSALSRLANEEERRKKKKETKKIVHKVRQSMKDGGDSSSSSTGGDSSSDSGSDDSSSDSDAKKKKKTSHKRKKKAHKKKKKKASSSDCDEASSKGASKTKKKKLSKMGRLHQELQALKEEHSVKTTEREEFQKELKARFEKLEAHLVDGKAVLHTPEKAPLTKEDILEVIAEAGSRAHEKAEASRPSKGILAWFDEVASTPSSTADPPEPNPSKQVKAIVARLREWLDVVAKDPKKYVPLKSKNPTLDAKGNTLCGTIAKKVSSWFANPADLALLNELVKDFDLSTQASTPSTIIKALLVVLLSRKFDYNPEHLLVSKSDIMASVKRS